MHNGSRTSSRIVSPGWGAGIESLAIKLFVSIVGDFQSVRISVLPNETDAILVVDSYAMLALPRSLEGFQSVAGDPSQIAKGSSLIQLDELTKCGFLNQPELLRSLLPKGPFSRRAPKGLNRALSYIGIRQIARRCSPAPTPRNAPPAPGRKSSPPRSPRRVAARVPWDSAHPALPCPYMPGVRS